MNCSGVGRVYTFHQTVSSTDKTLQPIFAASYGMSLVPPPTMAHKRLPTYNLATVALVVAIAATKFQIEILDRQEGPLVLQADSEGY